MSLPPFEGSEEKDQLRRDLLLLRLDVSCSDSSGADDDDPASPSPASEAITAWLCSGSELTLVGAVDAALSSLLVATGSASFFSGETAGAAGSGGFGFGIRLISLRLTRCDVARCVAKNLERGTITDGPVLPMTVPSDFSTYTGPSIVTDSWPE